MKPIRIIQAAPFSNVGAKLNLMALDAMAEVLTGTADSAIEETTLQRLWTQKNNRFSYEYAFEAKQGDRTLGQMTCYPTTVLNRLAIPTVRQLLKIRRWPLFFYVLKNFGSVWNLLNLKEGRSDEFHVGTIATLPKSRGLGIGTQLLLHAEDVARKNGFQKISLTVKQKNVRARELYQRVGYEVQGKVDKAPFFLYRMMKPISVE